MRASIVTRSEFILSRQNALQILFFLGSISHCLKKSHGLPLLHLAKYNPSIPQIAHYGVNRLIGFRLGYLDLNLHEMQVPSHYIIELGLISIDPQLPLGILVGAISTERSPIDMPIPLRELHLLSALDFPCRSEVQRTAFLLGVLGPTIAVAVPRAFNKI